MLQVLPVDSTITKYLKKRGLENKFHRQIIILSTNLKHPGLQVERLNPPERGIYSFRIDKKYRGIFVFLKGKNAIEILDANDHYK